jgi:hypothetical protein
MAYPRPHRLQDSPYRVRMAWVRASYLYWMENEIPFTLEK